MRVGEARARSHGEILATDRAIIEGAFITQTWAGAQRGQRGPLDQLMDSQ